MQTLTSTTCPSLNHVYVGRNGGHLAPNRIYDFHARSQTYGQDEAIRSVSLETRTVSEVSKIIEDQGWGHAIDLVHTKRKNLLFTQREQDAARVDIEAAKDAGVDLDGVEWISKKANQKVS